MNQEHRLRLNLETATHAVLEHPDTVSVLDDRPLYWSLSRYVKELGIRGGPTNISIFVEGLRRGLPITATKNGGMKFHGDGTQWWNNGASSLNHLVTRRICRQKEVASRVFRAQGVQAPENAVFDEGQAERAWAWAQPIVPVVVKPFDGSKGQGVRVGLKEKQEFTEAFDTVVRDFGQVLVEQQLAGKEHRVFVVNNRVHAVLRQIPANVLGDGRSSVTDLVKEKNKTATHPHKPITFGDTELRSLTRLGLTPDSVVEEGSRIFLRQNTNLSTGGDSIDATEELTSAEKEFVRNAARCWPGLGCAGFDVMLPRSEQDDPPAIIEINISPGISAHMMPRIGESRNVAAPILDAMFPDTAGAADSGEAVGPVVR